MRSHYRLRSEQKRRLAMLLRLQNAQEQEKRIELLETFIKDTEIEMKAEDVAYVQKKLEESN